MTIVRAEVLALLAMLSLSGCTAEPARPSAEVTRPVLTTPAEPAAEATLSRLVVADRPGPAEDYRRDAFGTPWKDTDGNGCNQRDDVMLRDAVKDTVRTGWQGDCDHDVLAGTWIDPYAGRVHRLTDAKAPAQAQAVQIDHVVPLAEAWVSGARAWPESRREQYANDLSGLLAVDGRTNASKGASDPAAWRPRKAYQCAYATRWISTKHRWRLSADPSEVRALREMLGYC